MSGPYTIYTVGQKDRGKRLDLFLHERIPGLSRSRIQAAIHQRVGLSWGVEPRPSARVRPGGKVSVGYTPLVESPLEVSIPVLAREPGWLAVNKPAGMPVHPVNHTRENSLIKILRRQEGTDELRLAHRLDGETSGVLLIAGDAGTARKLSMAFEQGKIHKEYLALVHGRVERDEGRVSSWIGRASDSRVHVRLGVTGDGKRAETRWRVERRLGDRTLLRVFPRTGRRHQIRVHLAAMGHPLLGDILYGRPDEDYLDLIRGIRDVREQEGGPRRHLLHSERLVLPETFGRGKTGITAPLPEDFLEALDS